MSEFRERTQTRPTARRLHRPAVAVVVGTMIATTLATTAAPAQALTGVRATPVAISPNGDGLRDSTVLRWSTTAAWPTTVRVTAPGRTVRGPIALGVLPAGTHGWRWDGRDNNGRLVASGRYGITVRNGFGASSVGGGTVVTVDRVRPNVSTPAATTNSVYPVRDGFRDTTSISWRTDERTSANVLEIRNRSGALSRRFNLGPRAAGVVTVNWNGRSAGGRVLPDGPYSLRVTATDPAGNRDVARGRLTVSTKSLRTVSGSTAITPRWTIRSAAVGTCSLLARDYPVRTGWTGSIGLYSDYQDCGVFGGPDVVTTTHAITPPRPGGFVRWQQLGVSGVGDQALWQSGQDAQVRLLRNDGTTASTRTLTSPFGAWSTPSLPASQALNSSGQLRWQLRVDTGSWYEVRSFSVRWTATVLR